MYISDMYITSTTEEFVISTRTLLHRYILSLEIKLKNLLSLFSQNHLQNQNIQHLI